jgi:hypothetical protein
MSMTGCKSKEENDVSDFFEKGFLKDKIHYSHVQRLYLKEISVIMDWTSLYSGKPLIAYLYGHECPSDWERIHLNGKFSITNFFDEASWNAYANLCFFKGKLKPRHGIFPTYYELYGIDFDNVPLERVEYMDNQICIYGLTYLLHAFKITEMTLDFICLAKYFAPGALQCPLIHCLFISYYNEINPCVFYALLGTFEDYVDQCIASEGVIQMMESLFTRGYFSRGFANKYCASLIRRRLWVSFAIIVEGIEDRTFFTGRLDTQFQYDLSRDSEGKYLVFLLDSYREIIPDNLCEIARLLKKIKEEYRIIIRHILKELRIEGILPDNISIE